MKYNFCTLFDKNYLYRGLALYNSLLKHCPDFKLWILCMDDIAYNLLNKMNLYNVELISLKEFENQELLKIKNTRTAVEYCWTCTSSLLYYLLKKYSDLKMLAYLDSDMYFYSSPQPIYDEMGDKSIMIIPHKLSPANKQLETTSGKYNVGMLIFKNNKDGINCLGWWKDKCIDWCYNYYDKGRYGDQLYLNDWPEKFSGVCVLKHKGTDIAPWNVSQYKVKKINNQILIDNEPLIFYHFHSLKIYSNLKFRLFGASYKISPKTKKIIYRPYVKELKEIIINIRTIDSLFNYGFSPQPSLLTRTLSNNKPIKLHAIFKKVPLYHKLYKYVKTLIYDKKNKS